MQVRGHHIRREGELFVVDVPGDNARRVAVLADWEDDLDERLERVGADDYVFCPRRRTKSRAYLNEFISRSNGSFKPTVQRLRATWLLHHLMAATPVRMLCDAAGVSTFQAFGRLLEFLPRPDERDALVVLRNSRQL
jgi:hypothetical protein